MWFGGMIDYIVFDVVNGGVYVSFILGNIFINVLGKYDYYWVNVQSLMVGFDRKFYGYLYGVCGEVGIWLGNNLFFIELFVQIFYVWILFFLFFVQGISVIFDDCDGLCGKVGVCIGGVIILGEDIKLLFYVGGNYVYDFKDESLVIFVNVGGMFNVVGFCMLDYGEVFVGINIVLNCVVSGFIEGIYIWIFYNGLGEVNWFIGVGGCVGINVKF